MPAFSTSMRSQVETCCASEAKVFWCCASDVDHWVSISSIVLPARRDCVDGADVLAAAGVVAAGPAVEVAAPPPVPAEVVAPPPNKPLAVVPDDAGAAVDAVPPNNPPVEEPDAAGAPLEAGACEAVVLAPPNKFEALPAAVVGVVEAPPCEVEVAAPAPPARLENRFDDVPVLAGVAEAPDVPPRLLNKLGV